MQNNRKLMTINFQSLIGSILMACISIPAIAAMPKAALIEGKVMDINKNIIGIQTKTGEVKVPRSSIKHGHKIHPGSHVQARPQMSELFELNKD